MYNKFLPEKPSPLGEGSLGGGFSHSVDNYTDNISDSDNETELTSFEEDDEDKSETDTQEDSAMNSFMVQNIDLASFPLFQKAPKSFYRNVLLHLQLVTYHPSQFIIRQGEESKSMYWVLKGVVAVTSSDGDSIYNELVQGQFFGEIGILFNRPRSANVIATTKVVVGVLTSKDFNVVLKSFPMMERRIRDEAQGRMAILNRQEFPSIIDKVDATISVKAFLKNVPIFQNLPAYIIHKLVLGVRLAQFQPFECVIHEGDAESNIYFIVSGQVEVLKKNVPIARLTEGNYFGEMSFLSWLKAGEEAKRTASIRSITSVELLVITSNLLRQLCKEYPFLLDHMMFTSDVRNATPSYPIPPRIFGPPKVLQPVARRPASPPPALPAPTKTPPLDAYSMTRPRPKRLKSFQNQQEYSSVSKRMKMGAYRPKPSNLSVSSRLNDFILLRIFQFLDLPTLMKLRIICRRWRQLLYMSLLLFSVLDLTAWNTSIDDTILVEIIKFVGLRPQHIDILNCFHITDVGFSYMVNEIGLNGRIKSIKLASNWEISGMAIMDLSGFVGRHLEEIDLSNCRKVRDDVVERLICTDDEEGEKYGCNKLTRINVGYCKHLTDRFMYFIDRNCHDKLQELDLTRCTTITDQGFEYWAYHQFPNLTKLSLKDCTFLTDKAIMAIAHAAPYLEELDLGFCCSLTDISIEILCLLCIKIRHLNLNFCGSAVSDSSLLAISMSMKNLEKLTIKGCIRVTRAGIDSLLSSDSNLRFMDISQCKNSSIYPGNIPAQKFAVNSNRRAFVTAGNLDKIVEIKI